MKLIMLLGAALMVGLVFSVFLTPAIGGPLAAGVFYLLRLTFGEGDR